MGGSGWWKKRGVVVMEVQGRRGSVLVGSWEKGDGCEVAVAFVVGGGRVGMEWWCWRGRRGCRDGGRWEEGEKLPFPLSGSK